MILKQDSSFQVGKECDDGRWRVELALTSGSLKI